MSDERAICGAKTRAGTPCQRSPHTGATRCRLHGGHPRSGAPPIHGKYSKRFAKIGPIAQDAIDEAIRDPDLLDVRRTVALQTVIVQQASLIPDDELVILLAKRMSKWRPNFKEDETWEDQPAPTDAEIEAARMVWLTQSAKLVESYGDSQIAAAKQVQLGDLLSKEIVPILLEFGLRLAKLADRYVPKADREAFNAGFRMEARRVVVDIKTVIKDGT